jgi:tetratricopeptide (TPR) repeat protein
MCSQSRFLIVLVVVMAATGSAVACMWDYDTLKQERAQFPSALELITGKFLRHSPDFYRWRIDDRLKKLKSNPTNLAYHDDLAVAYSKTGQYEKAVETILAKDKIKPGLYETYSNLGTFHILAGEFEKGIPFINSALVINPDAHFGREKYQKWLVEYALTKRANGVIPYPMQTIPEPESGELSFYRNRKDFQTYVAKSHLEKDVLPDEERKAAVKAILGMMRFANHENPLLLEALGDLLRWEWDQNDAKRLSARCYLKASYVIKDETSKQRYRELAAAAITLQTRSPLLSSTVVLTLDELEVEFRKQIADADEWYAKLAQKERDWIREGKDVEAEFDRLYDAEPSSIGEPSDDVIERVTNRAILIGSLLLVGMIAIGYYMIFQYRMSRKKTSVRPNS